jgi:alkane 1-monooxygenase
MIALIGALVHGGWVIYAASGSIILMSGAIDEVVGDHDQRLDEHGRLFCDINLYATLPLLMIITYLLLAGDVAPRVSAPVMSVIAVGYLYAIAGGTVAHELTHRVSSRLALIWARVLIAFTLNPTFESYHVSGHHRNVGTYHDPSTARRGEYVLAFVARQLVCQSIEGWRLEADRLRRKKLSIWSWRNRVLGGTFCSAVIVAVAAVMAGAVGIGTFLAAAIFGRIPARNGQLRSALRACQGKGRAYSSPTLLGLLPPSFECAAI